MLGVLVVGFCGFLSFCVGVCRFLAGSVGWWIKSEVLEPWRNDIISFLRVLLAVVVLVLFFVLVRRERRCVYLRVFSPRRRFTAGRCTTFYKLDLRFTYLTRRNSRTL
jgi:hypothetical protein